MELNQHVLLDFQLYICFLSCAHHTMKGIFSVNVYPRILHSRAVKNVVTFICTLDIISIKTNGLNIAVQYIQYKCVALNIYFTHMCSCVSQCNVILLKRSKFDTETGITNSAKLIRAYHQLCCYNEENTKLEVGIGTRDSVVIFVCSRSYAIECVLKGCKVHGS